MRIFFQRLSHNFVRHDVMTLSAALAFYGVLSAAPLLILVVSILGMIGIESQRTLIDYASATMGPQTSQLIEVVIRNANQNIHLNSFAQVFAIAFFLFSAGGVYVQIQYSLNVVWDTRPLGSAKHEVWNWVKKRLASLLFIVLIVGFTLGSITLDAASRFLFEEKASFLRLSNYLVSTVFFVAMFYFTFRYVPDAKTESRSCFWGALVVGVLFNSGKDIVGKYLGSSAIASAYGSAGSLLILLMWFYYSAMLVFLGAEICRSLQELRAKPESKT